MLKRKKPLTAKQALRRSQLRRGTTTLKRLAKIKPTGKRHARRASWMVRCRAATMLRAAVTVIDDELIYIRCEECSRIIGAGESEWHHVFGRSLGVAGKSKWCHVKELT